MPTIPPVSGLPSGRFEDVQTPDYDFKYRTRISSPTSITSTTPSWETSRCLGFPDSVRPT